MKKVVYTWTNKVETRTTSNIVEVKHWLEEEGGTVKVTYKDIKPAFKGVPYTKNPKSKFYREGM
jgi:hypothetical protein